MDCLFLYNVFKKFNLSYCDVVKMNIESMEYDVLDNTSHSVLKYIREIILDYHPKSYKSTRLQLTKERLDSWVLFLIFHRIYANNLFQK